MVLFTFFWDLIVRLCIGLVLVVIHTFILQKIASRMEFEDKSFDNPTSIGIVLAILFVIISYLAKIGPILFIVGCSVFPIVLLKEFYMIKWKRAIEAWVYWLISWVLLAVLLAILAILIF